MAHFAKLDENNIVTEVLVVNNEVLLKTDGTESEYKGKVFLNGLFGNSTWIQTSYNTRAGQHDLGGTPLRKNFARIGYIYDSEKDAFYAPQPYPSWTLNEDTCLWEAPVACPESEDRTIKYTWNEITQAWNLQE